METVRVVVLFEYVKALIVDIACADTTHFGVDIEGTDQVSTQPVAPAPATIVPLLSSPKIVGPVPHELNCEVEALLAVSICPLAFIEKTVEDVDDATVKGLTPDPGTTVSFEVGVPVPIPVLAASMKRFFLLTPLFTD